MYKRKTIDCWKFYLNYGQGWEHEITEYSKEMMKINKKAYMENSQYPLKIVKKREKISNFNPIRVICNNNLFS
jgi:hypothetical protein